MTYVTCNPKTKKELKELLKKGPLAIHEHALGSIPQNGRVFLEGPHFPAAHKWAAEGTTKDGMLVSIK